ncbi:proline--tRNA ligase [Candidatus Peregrinibacteria bacterium CG1_02_41_10]|nr:MAG: proline--tRNA ligase [Candidatus Peregrinibacteria bacterium CG1_02_41_10]
MLYSRLFGKTVKHVSEEMTVVSHKYLYQGGFIRESTAGRYYSLPLGMRVNDKIIKVIEEEMDRAGAQKMITPVLHPLELWEETSRAKTVGFELMTIQDRRGAKFVLGGTAEEMMVDVVRKFNVSYKDLPFNIYQFSQKFRDELRARGGLLRVREFMMKDAYSFDRDAQEFEKEYQKMWETYERIFERLGLKTIVVESDNGYIGGEYCHEFIVESEMGESKVLVAQDGSYAAHEEVARFLRDAKNLTEKEKPLQEVEAKRGNKMEDGVKLHKLPLWQQLKDFMVVDENGRLILALIRGDREINETKLKHVVKANTLRHATETEIRAVDSEPGFISPVGVNHKKVLVVGDLSLKTVRNFYGGANRKYRDLLNVNYGRDFTVEFEADIGLAKAGDLTEDGKSVLDEKRGIEVGNIFQLGTHYTDLMQGALFTDQDGKSKPFYMGCYGIGVGRTLATIVEKYHDDKGIIWPKIVAPYLIHLIQLGNSKSVLEVAVGLHRQLEEEKIEVLYDDRESVSAGEKFADADLIGIPIRLVVSEKTLKTSAVEWKGRGEKEVKLVLLKKVIGEIKTWLKE